MGKILAALVYGVASALAVVGLFWLLGAYVGAFIGGLRWTAGF